MSGRVPDQGSRGLVLMGGVEAKMTRMLWRKIRCFVGVVVVVLYVLQNVFFVWRAGDWCLRQVVDVVSFLCILCQK